jgi:gliding motility-associated-like protein
LLNRSQRVCTAPVDTVPPCPPTLTVTNDCGLYAGQGWTPTQFINHLVWNRRYDSCGLTTTHYRVYYNASDSSNFVIIDSTSSASDTTFDHILNDNLAGCYAVTAVDKAGIESAMSNIVCIDNCPYYVLPNSFTPDGDGHNDHFTPFPGYRFVPKIEMKIYNRWGELVFETTDPNINWDGKDLSGHPVSDGVYLYAGYYYEQRINGLVKKPLSGSKKGGGFIHVIRGK